MKKRLQVLCACLLAFIASAQVDAQQVLVSTGFDGYAGTLATAPAGWTLSGNGLYNTAGNFGLSSPSYKMSKATGDSITTIITPQFANADSVSFWIKHQPATQSADTNFWSFLNIYESVDTVNWNLISSFDTLSSTATVITTAVPVTAQYLKLAYKKVKGNLAIDDIKVTRNVFGTPVAAFSSNSACLGDTTFFTENSTINGGTITNWAWNFGDGSAPFIGQNPPPHIYATAGIFNVTLLVTDNTLDTNSITQAVNVNPLPTVSFTASPVSGCAPLSVLFTDNSTIPVGGLINRWSFGNGNMTTAHNLDTLYTYNTPGTFTVVLRELSQAGCIATDSVVGMITVNAAPAANYSYSTNGNAVSFTNASTGGTSYDWNFGDGSAHVTTADANHTFTNPGSYTVCLTVTSANSCTDSVCKNVVIADPAGIKTNEGGRLSISPNPSQGLFNINFGEAVDGSVGIKVFSILGQEVDNFESRRTSSSSFLLDLTNQNKGVYFIQINSAKGVQTSRVSITR